MSQHLTARGVTPSITSMVGFGDGAGPENASGSAYGDEVRWTVDPCSKLLLHRAQFDMLEACFFLPNSAPTRVDRERDLTLR
jgi:hypothetical protein